MQYSKSVQRSQLCISLPGPTLSDLLQQLQRAIQWADLIEIRLDKIKDFDIHSYPLIRQCVSCPLIWTFRKASQGGEFDGTDEGQFHFLCRLMKYAPDFVDLEADTPKEFVHALQKLSPSTQWIISWHDLLGTPVCLDSLYQKVVQHKADYYKIATLAKKTTDSLRMLNFVNIYNQNQNKLCGMCFGNFGSSTRILGPITGQPFIFASLDAHQETAPGQIPADELVNRYNFYRMNRETQIFGLIGRPIETSLSHITHNAVLKNLELNAVYLKFHLEDEELSCFFEEAQKIGIKGLSVTMPFKEKVLYWVQKPHEMTSCNTLKWSIEGLKGCNTDGIGALKALNLPFIKGQKIIILGAGGTAKAIAQVASQHQAEVAILNRTVEKAKYIAESLNARWGSLDQFPLFIQEGYHCIIQATAVGMTPYTEDILISPEWITAKSLALDVISHPKETRFLREVRYRGGKAISGCELFIHQAVEQFNDWFDSSLSRSQIESMIRQQMISSPSSLKKIKVKKSCLQGEMYLPSSKSHSIRAILLAAMSKGTSILSNILNSPDCICALEAARQLGAQVEMTSQKIEITGVGGYPKVPKDIINVGNSGQVLRFAAALASLATGYTVFTGDESIRTSRPVQPLIDGLQGLGGVAISTQNNGHAPLIVKGPLKAGSTTLEGQDSQPVSALLMAASFLEGETEIKVHQMGEKPWINLTLSWLDRLKVSYTHHQFEHFIVQGKRQRSAFNFTVPGDLSSLAFPLAAALVTQSELTIHHVNLQDIQGDKILVCILQQMGACLEIDSLKNTLKVLPTEKLKGQQIDVNDLIDAVPILAVLGCYAEGETHLVNGSIARRKESNRLASITAELRKMGASIEETEDGLKVRQSILKGTCVNSHQDHRIALSLVIAGLGAKGVTEIAGIECINKSYSTFIEDLCKVGANLF